MMVKRILAMVAALVCVFSLTGCGEEGKAEKEASVAESVEDKAENSDEDKKAESEDSKTIEIEDDGQSGYATPEDAVRGIENFSAMKDATAYVKMINEDMRKKFEEENDVSQIYLCHGTK